MAGAGAGTVVIDGFMETATARVPGDAVFAASPPSRVAGVAVGAAVGLPTAGGVASFCGVDAGVAFVAVVAVTVTGFATAFAGGGAIGCTVVVAGGCTGVATVGEVVGCRVVVVV